MQRLQPPAEVEQIVRTLEAEPRRRIARHLGLAAMAAVLAGLGVLLWRFSSAEIDTTALLAFLDRAGASRIAPLAALLAFAVGGLIVFPLNILIAATVVTFGPVSGTCYALLGSLASAALLYELGRFAPERLRHFLVNARTERVIERIARRGTLAVAVVRLFPIAPYSVVSLLAGTAHVPRGGYLLGTTLGLVPGILLYALFADRARGVLENPRPETYLLLLFAIAAIVAASLVLKSCLHHVRQRRRRR